MTIAHCNMLIERCFMRDSLNPFLFAMPIQSVNIIIIIITRRAHIESKNSWNCIMNLIFADSVKPIYGTHTHSTKLPAWMRFSWAAISWWHSWIVNCKYSVMAEKNWTEPNHAKPNRRRRRRHQQRHDACNHQQGKWD